MLDLIPKGWTVATVGDLGEVRLGRQRSPHAERGRFMKPYLRVANVFDGYIDRSDILEMNFSPEEQRVYDVKNGDILLNEGQSIDLVGRCAKYDGAGGEFCFQNTLIRYRCSSYLDPNFAYQLFAWWRRIGRFAEVAKQTTSIAHLGADRFAAMSIAVPTMREQQQISEVLMSVDESISRSIFLLEKMRRVDSGAIREFFHGGNFREASSLKASLGSVADISSGVTLGADIRGPGTVELPYLRVANVKEGVIDTSDIKTVRVRESDLSRFVLRSGDVLMTEGGDFDKLGRGAVWDGRINNCLHQNHIFRVRCNVKKIIPEFLSIYSNSPYGRRWFMNVSKQTTNLASISSAQLHAFPVPCPPVAEQQAIVRNVLTVRDRIGKLEGEIAKLNAVKAGLWYDLLGGRTRVKV